jgi:hypothetical protein
MSAQNNDSFNPFSFKDERLEVNPFTDIHWNNELRALGLRRSTYQVDDLRVGWFKPEGRLDDYLSVNWRYLQKRVPYLAINGVTWMSITPMEVQSMALAIHRAFGHVITLGLGLGYYALRVAAKDSVKKVTVFEKTPDIAAWFKKAYKDRPELAKIEIVEGDARKCFKGFECDFCFADIYLSMLEEETLADVSRFRRANKIGRYHYWGYERVVRDMLFRPRPMLRHARLVVGRDLRHYLKQWFDTPFMDSGQTMGETRYTAPLKDDFLKRARRLMTDFPI